MNLLRDAMVAAAAIMAVVPARAAQWVITPSAAVEETYTDNLGLRRDSEDRNSDLVTTLSPGVSVRGTGGRVQLNGDYTFNLVQPARATDQNSWRQNLDANGSAELWEKSFFLDGAAQIHQGVANTQAPTSGSAANAGVNTLQTTSWTVGPRFLHHFGTWAETTSFISHRSVATDNINGGINNGATSGTVTGTAPIRSASIDTSSFQMQSGRRFTQTLWSATVREIRTSTNQAPHHDDKLARVDLTYVVNRQLSLNGGGGWQIINDQALVNSLTGPVWSFGATYRPGRRLTLQLAYNKQFDRKFLTYNGTYVVSPRTRITLSHTESITTTTQLLAQRQPVFDPISGQFIDPLTGLPVNPNALPTGLQENTVRQKVWQANFSTKNGRNTYDLILNRTESIVEPSGQRTTQTGAILTFSHAMTHRLNGTLSANYRVSNTSNGPTTLTGVTAPTLTNGSSTNVQLSGTLSYTLARKTTADFTLRYTAFDAGSANLNAHEKSASISLRRTF